MLTTMAMTTTAAAPAKSTGKSRWPFRTTKSNCNGNNRIFSYATATGGVLLSWVWLSSTYVQIAFAQQQGQQQFPSLSYKMDCVSLTEARETIDSSSSFRNGEGIPVLTVMFEGVTVPAQANVSLDAEVGATTTSSNTSSAETATLLSGPRPWIGLYRADVFLIEGGFSQSQSQPLPLPSDGLIGRSYLTGGQIEQVPSNGTVEEVWPQSGQVVFDVRGLASLDADIQLVLTMSLDDVTAATMTQPFTINGVGACGTLESGSNGTSVDQARVDPKQVPSNADPTTPVPASTAPVSTFAPTQEITQGAAVPVNEQSGTETLNNVIGNNEQSTPPPVQESTPPPVQESTPPPVPPDLSNWQPQGQRQNVCGGNAGAQRRRRPWRTLTCEEQDTFLNAVQALKENGLYNEFVEVHMEMNDQAHAMGEFLPWHRWFLLMFETALQDITGNCDLTVPFWDWEQDAGNEGDADVFHPQAFGRFECGGSDAALWAPWVQGDEAQSVCLQRTYGRQLEPGRGRFASSISLIATIVNFVNYGDTTNSLDPATMNGFHPALEGQPHSVVHWFVGGPMFDFRSPMDPLFWIHHSSVDRIWALHQDYWDHDLLSPEQYQSPTHYDGDNVDIDSPLPFPVETRWDYSQNGDGSNTFPTPRQVLNNLDLRVTYIGVDLVGSLESVSAYVPNLNLFEPSIETGIGCIERSGGRRRQEESGNASSLRGANKNDPSLHEHTESFTAHNRQYFVGSQQQQQQLKKRSIPSFSIDVGSGCDAPPSSSGIDSERWTQLCLSGKMRSLEDMLATLAEMDCHDREDSSVAASSYGDRANESITDDHLVAQWIHHMGLSSVKQAVLECFHRPDSPA